MNPEIKVGQTYESLDPRDMRDGESARRLDITGISTIMFGKFYAEAESYWRSEPQKRRPVRISFKRLLSKAYRLVK